MYIDFDTIDARARYKLLAATVIPRPIALITTQDAKGCLNAAPFSFFNVFSEDPALAIIGLEARLQDDDLKDTTRNLSETGELVINLVDRTMAEPMAACAAPLERGEDELAFAGLTPAPSQRVSVPGIAQSPIRLECRLFELRQITPRRHLCIAEILAMHSRDGVINSQTLHVDLNSYTPIGRLFGDRYCNVSENFTIPVPSAPKTKQDPS